MTPEETALFAARRRSRGIALGIVLIVIVLLVYGITIVRMT